MTVAGTTTKMVNTTLPSSGKWYWEWKIQSDNYAHYVVNDITTRGVISGMNTVYTFYPSTDNKCKLYSSFWILLLVLMYFLPMIFLLTVGMVILVQWKYTETIQRLQSLVVFTIPDSILYWI